MTVLSEIASSFLANGEYARDIFGDRCPWLHCRVVEPDEDVVPAFRGGRLVVLLKSFPDSSRITDCILGQTADDGSDRMFN
jgi:hypothetical protein